MDSSFRNKDGWPVALEIVGKKKQKNMLEQEPPKEPITEAKRNERFQEIMQLEPAQRPPLLQSWGNVESEITLGKMTNLDRTKTEAAIQAAKDSGEWDKKFVDKADELSAAQIALEAGLHKSAADQLAKQVQLL